MTQSKEANTENNAKEEKVTVRVNPTSDASAEELKVTANTEATDPFFVDNSDPADPNGYNNAPREADGFIKNPVAGGAFPLDINGDVINGVTQADGDDLPDSNVDPEGVIKRGATKAKGTRKSSK